MSLGGLLSLKWNNHCSTFLHILSTLHRKQSYDDATVACDGKLYPVHKLVLSTCSEYFEEMFEKTHGKHPVIVLKDIKKEVFEALLKYMYIGEVNVVQEKLAELINAAECLKIKGLAVPDEEPEPVSHNSSNKNKPSSHDSSSSSRSSVEKDPTYQSSGRSARAGVTNNQSTKRKESQSFHNSNAPPRKIPRASNEALRCTLPAESNVKVDDRAESLSFGSTVQLPQNSATRENRSSLDERTSTSSSLTNNEESDVTVWPTAVKEEPLDPAPDEVSATSGVASELVDDGTLSSSQNNNNNGDNDGGGGSGHDDGGTGEHEDNGEGIIDDEGTQPASSTPQSEEKNEESSAEPSSDQHEMMTSKVEVEESSDDWEGVLTEKGDGDDAEALNSMLSGDDASNTAADDRTSGWPSDDRLASAFQRRNHASQHCSLPYEALQLYQVSNASQLSYGHQDDCNIPPSAIGAGGCSLLLPVEKRFQCPVCPYATHKKDHITKHVRTHTGEKPFSCPHCQYRSANKANLDRHVKLHIEMARFECAWCSFTSLSSQELDLHQRNAHCRGLGLDESAV